MPPFFNGMSFQEAMKIIYFCSVDLSDSFSIDYNGTNQIKVDNQKKSGLLLIGIECKDSVTDTLHFLINPLNYTIRTDDIGYIIAYDRNQTKSIMNFSTKSPQYNTYSKNINFFKRFKVKETSPPYINKLASDLNKHFQDWTINKSKFFKNNYKNEESAKNLNSQRHIPDIFNLNENISPKGIFINHIIIKGSLSRLSRIAVVIRSYSERPILLFSEQKENPSEWNKIREAFKNVFYIRGITSNINHITQLDPKKAFKILILSDNLNNFVLSSENIIFTRIISDFFELTNFLTELSDETHIKYLSINPKYPNMDFFFWPFFVRGSVHFSSMTMSIIAKTIINKNWISFIQNLSKTSEKKISDYEQNEKINTLVLSAEVAKEFQMLGHLQYALMTHKPQAIVIAILKTKGKENNNNKFGSTLLRKKTIGSVSVEPNSQNMISHQISRIMSNFYGSEFLMTNPSFLTPLVEGDKVLIIGKLEYNNERKMMENSVISNNDPLNIQQKYTNIDFRASTIPKTEYERRKSQVIKEKMGNAMSQLNGLITVLVNASEDIKHKLYKAPKNRVNHN